MPTLAPDPADRERRTRAPRREPFVSIELRLESSPRINVCADTEQDFERLVDWLTNGGRLHKLLLDAIELSPLGRAA